MKFTQDVCMDEKISWAKYLYYCMETTIKTGAVLVKFTQDVCMDEQISQTKILKIGREEGVPLIDLYF